MTTIKIRLPFALSLLGLLGSAVALGQTLFVPGGSVGNISGSNVGIGTSTPDAGTKLQVTGGILTSAAFSSTVASSGGMDYFSTGLRLFSMGASGSTKGTFMFYAKGADNSSSIPLVVDSSGNVGIGTTSPAEKLDVAGNLNGGRYLRLSDGTNPFMRLAKTGGTARTLDINGGDSFALTWAAGGSGTFVFDNAGNVGIGTTTPGSLLHIYKNGTNGAINEMLVLDSGTENQTVSGSGATVAFKSLTNSYYGAVGGYGNGSATGVGLWSGAGGGAPSLYLTSGNVGIGTTNPGTYRLAVNGNIHAKEVIVDTGWSDYVFDDGYKLKALSEVEAYVKTEKHLPGIPSAKEVAERGVSMGEMQSKLLAKVEELTLHLIAQEKRMAAQSMEISSLKTENVRLRGDIHALRPGHP